MFTKVIKYIWNFRKILADDFLLTYHKYFNFIKLHNHDVFFNKHRNVYLGSLKYLNQSFTGELLF